MKTLILRTFAHPNIWEGQESSCHFEFAQKDQILEWEPNFLQFIIDDFEKALSIYSEKYFSGYYEKNTGTRKIAYTGSPNERIISELVISPCKW